MQRILVILLALLGVMYSTTSFPYGASAVLVVLLLAVPSVFFIRKRKENKEDLTNIFLIALLLRLTLGLIIFYFGLYSTFGPDASAYDFNGYRLMLNWGGADFEVFNPITGRSGYGMIYLVAGFYWLFGQSILIPQSFCAVIGALTAPMVYYCAHNIYENKRVAKYAAYGVALFPSFIIWSSQLLKDGLIIFLLVVIMTALLQLMKKLSYGSVIILLLSMMGIYSLRFYIFYMVAVAVAGSILISLTPDVKAIGRNFAIALALGIGLAYFGVGSVAVGDLSTYANLEQIQFRRQALSEGADSGFVGDTDVTTTAGALTAVPLGFAYLAFAPFPWQINKMSQALVIPETLLWWALLPLVISGVGWTLRNRLRKAIPILLFSSMLTFAYSIFQGNVGMAYRQRTQIQVFVFMFIAVGVTLIIERRENEKTLQQIRKAKVAKERAAEGFRGGEIDGIG